MATTGKQPGARGLGLWVIVFGIIFIVAGAVTWGAVSTNLAAENITVSDDASAFQGQLVDTPWEAWVQADIINHHALDSSGGKTYAELDRDDPVRETMMTASFLRSSLFTSVVAFGVALLVVGVGVTLLLVGIALRRLSPVVVDDDTSAHTRVAPAVAPASASPVVAAPAAPAPPVTAPPAPVAPATAAPTTAAPTTAAPPAVEGHTHAAPPDPTVERDDRA
ncbi:aromatic ring-opening dioxygenase LigA [Cellulomonas sp. CW35]|uniref:aromatic ring-opening dioxygenase LigA n=1 Tax=Cellulomonas sp. CW35 TaxID=3458249 RepID=UPI0040341F97